MQTHKQFDVEFLEFVGGSEQSRPKAGTHHPQANGFKRSERLIREFARVEQIPAIALRAREDRQCSRLAVSILDRATEVERLIQERERRPEVSGFDMKIAKMPQGARHHVSVL